MENGKSGYVMLSYSLTHSVALSLIRHSKRPTPALIMHSFQSYSYYDILSFKLIKYIDMIINLKLLKTKV
jgi:hypothetical protein